MTAPVLGTVVWGAEYCRMLVEWHVPSLLLGDIAAFGSRLEYYVYTNKPSLAALEGLHDPIVADVLDIKIVVIPDEIFDAHIGNGDVGQLKRSCQIEFIARAWEQKRPFMWHYPDTIFSPGAFASMKRHADGGARALVATGMVARLPSLEQSPEIKEAIFGFQGPPLEWGALFLDHLHPFVGARMWHGRRPIGHCLWPAYLYCETDQGLFMNILHPNPYYCDPRKRVVDSSAGLEDTFMDLAGISPEEVVVLDDGSFVLVEIANDDKPVHAPHVDPLLKIGHLPRWVPQVYDDWRSGRIPPLSDDFIARWARLATNSFQRRFFPRTIPLAVRPGHSLEDCRRTMRELSEHAADLVKRIESQAS